MSTVIRAIFGAGVTLYILTACTHVNISHGCDPSADASVPPQPNTRDQKQPGSVEGAELIGTLKGAKIYATSVNNGGVVVVSLADVSATATTVTWSGGSPGATPLQREVGRSLLNRAGEWVVAYANGQILFEGRFHVFEGAPAESAVAIRSVAHRDEKSLEGLPEDAFGTTRFFTEPPNVQKAPSAQYHVYYSRRKWRFTFESVSYEFTWGMRSRDRTDVDNPKADPFPIGLGMPVTSSEYEKKARAKADLSPDRNGHVARSSYYSSELVRQHELFHQKDFVKYFTRRMAEMELLIESQAVAVTPSCLDPNQVRLANAEIFDKRIRQASNQATNDYNGGDGRDERRAYDHGRAGYEAWSKAIQLQGTAR